MGEKFQDHFSDTVISTDTVYKSPNISIELTQTTYDSGMDDPDGEYGSLVTYTLADIYVSSIECFRTAFAQDSYGIGFQEKPQAMSERMEAVLSVNGDSYSKDNQLDNGTVIRNGMIYREQESSEETCVLFRDGTMKIYTPDSFQAKNVIRRGLGRHGCSAPVSWMKTELPNVIFQPMTIFGKVIPERPSAIMSRGIIVSL